MPDKDKALLPLPAGGGEPVAWRIVGAQGGVFFTEEAETARCNAANGWSVTALAEVSK